MIKISNYGCNLNYINALGKEYLSEKVDAKLSGKNTCRRICRRLVIFWEMTVLRKPKTNILLVCFR